jgi:hypothetical protein
MEALQDRGLTALRLILAFTLLTTTLHYAHNVFAAADYPQVEGVPVRLLAFGAREPRALPGRRAADSGVLVRDHLYGHGFGAGAVGVRRLGRVEAQSGECRRSIFYTTLT